MQTSRFHFTNPSSKRNAKTTAFLFLISLLLAAPTAGAADTPTGINLDHSPEFSSHFVKELVVPQGEEVPIDFCDEWNPEFVSNDGHCCGRSTGYSSRGRRGRGTRPRCDVHRNRQTYCDEITEEEKEYIEAVNNGEIGNVLDFLTAQVQHRTTQAYCSINNGFLVHGRAIVPTRDNLIHLRSPQRCTYFATDPMVAMLEWLGHQVKAEFYEDNPGIHILLGDVAAPRGGCLAAMGGRKGHKSHTVGQDADVALLTPRGKNQSPDFFHRDLQPKPNWWFLKKIFNNPFVCIKVVFFDRRNIAKLARAARGDPEWDRLRRFVRHIPGHRDHFHVRIGDGPGAPGCASNPDDEMDDEEGDGSGAEGDDSADTREFLDQLKGSAASEIPVLNVDSK